jgi:hypothetical protein
MFNFEKLETWHDAIAYADSYERCQGLAFVTSLKAVPFVAARSAAFLFSRFPVGLVKAVVPALGEAREET